MDSPIKLTKNSNLNVVNNNLVRKFINTSIMTNTEIAEIETSLLKQSVVTNNIKINGGTDYISQQHNIKALIMPNSSHSAVKDHMNKGYKLLKHS